MSPLIPLPAEPVRLPDLNQQVIATINGDITLQAGGPRALSSAVAENSVVLANTRLDDLFDLPDGIEYDAWVGLVDPAPRGNFADRLDLLDDFAE